MAQYGRGGGGGYGQANPYGQERRYEETASPYAQQTDRYGQQPAAAAYTGYTGRQEQGGYSDRSGQGPTGGNIGYGEGNDVEMLSMNGQAGAHAAAPHRDPNAILNECRDIDKGINDIERNLERLRFLHQRSIDDTDASQQTQTNRELDSLSTATMTLYKSFAGRIKAIKSQPASGEPRNAPQVGMVDRKLKKAINEYQMVDKNFRQKLAEQMERQYRIVRPDASEQEVREAVQDTSITQVFSKALLSQNRRGQAQSALSAVQGRHEAILKIEKDMVDLASLFAEMEAAVVTHQPAINNIQEGTDTAVTNVNKGNEQLNSAVDKARAARKKKWICLGIVVLIIIIIAVVVAIAVVVTRRQ